jgi:hypothetical protein
MMTYSRSLHIRHGFVAGFLCTLLATLFLPVTASAGESTKSDGVPPPWSPFEPLPTKSAPHWTFSAEAIVLGRTGGANQTLVARVPGLVPFPDTATAPGIEAFNSNQFQQGFSAGPRISLNYHGDSGYGAELSYFNIFDQRATKTIGPDSPADWLVMKAPGNFWQTQDFPYQGMVWKSATNLYSAEANGRLTVSSRVTVLAGVRWFQLNDTLQGTVTPADLTAPTWKQTCPVCNIFQITPGGPAGNYPPFWTTSTTNNLYGVQIGADVKMLDLGRFSLGGLMKIGLFDNHAEQSTGVSLAKVVYPSQATTNHAAFVGEAGLQLKYQVNEGVALKVGFDVLWFDGVALAPGQIQETFTIFSTSSSVRALGVNCGSGVFFYGTTAGLEYSF